ncbi:MAG: DUF736 domain-containing protein [Alphaproteobacteria bacterium]
MKNGKKSSIKIGSFGEDGDGFLHGRIYGLGLGVVPVLFEPQTSKGGKSYYRLVADPDQNPHEIGAAFPRDKDGMTYYSVSIDSPALPAPINAALFKDRENGAYNLVWSRQEEEKDLKAEATVNVNVQPQQQVTQGRKPNGQQPTLSM